MDLPRICSPASLYSSLLNVTTLKHRRNCPGRKKRLLLQRGKCFAMVSPSTHSNLASHSESSTILADRPATGSIKDLESGWVTDITIPKSDERQESKANKVTWDGPRDPENPQNWPFRQKFVMVAIVSAITFIRYGSVNARPLHSFGNRMAVL